MLISFSVTNFRSIREKQTIDMTPASKYHQDLDKVDQKSLSNNLFKTGEKTTPELLKSSVIYGANASGKTSVIRALYAFNAVALYFGANTKRARGKTINFYDPFVLDNKYHNLPTEFEIDFISNKKRYVYSFGYDQKKIHYEKLEFFKDEKKTLIYELKLNNKNQLEESFSGFFEGNKDRALDIIKNTGNNLFLPLNINEDGNGFLNPVYDWIENKLFIYGTNKRFDESAEWIAKSDKNKRNVVEILKRFDLGITDLKVSTSEKNLPQHITDDKDIPDSVKEHLKKQTEVKFKTKSGHSLDQNQISLGTRSIFSLTSLIFPVLENGGVLFFDELEQNLHSDILIYIVQMFHDPKINKGNGQIIFTALNDIFLEKDLLGKNHNLFRRDQVWFVNKANDASDFYSLVEFPAVRKDRNIAQKYRNGDFGAKPAIRTFRW
jgi:AAA15 family ATPase/GTPase